ncbi:hypothetical protein [Angustibacter aerolatus]
MDERRRRLVNALTLATPLGRLLARRAGAVLTRGPRGVLVAAPYTARFPAPRAPAVTIGDVVLLLLDDASLARRPALLHHEARHAEQWARWAGLLGFPLAYGLASAWSWLRVGDAACANRFEVGAGLHDGGYLRAGELPPPPRRLRRPGPPRRVSR